MCSTTPSSPDLLFPCATPWDCPSSRLRSSPFGRPCYRKGLRGLDGVLLAERGVQASAWADFRSQHLGDWLERETLPAGWIVVGMMSEHLAEARLYLPQHKLLLLWDCAGSGEIADPYMDAISYGAAFQQVERCVRVLVDRLLGK